MKHDSLLSPTLGMETWSHWIPWALAEGTFFSQGLPLEEVPYGRHVPLVWNCLHVSQQPLYLNVNMAEQAGHGSHFISLNKVAR